MARVDRGEIIDRARGLPAFPRVVMDVLASLDDDNATIGTLAHHVERDPVITARVLSMANSAVLHTYSGKSIRDIATATSMIGMARLREIALTLSLADFASKSRIPMDFWEHSVAVGVCSQELAKRTPNFPDHALVAGLLHDVGQLWMAKFHPLEFQQVRLAVSGCGRPMIEAEKEYLGLDHCEIGLLLAEHWGLPEPICRAIRHHHEPNGALGEKLVAVTHVAEVFSNALDLAQREENRVTGLSVAACAAVGIDWETDLRSLFGKIEARTRYACAVFR